MKAPVAVVLLLLALAPSAAGSSAGKLDPRFGKHGSTLLERSDDAGAESVALLADGRIMVGGWSQLAAWAARLTPRGRLDRSFGRRGQIVLPWWQGQIRKIVPLPDGRILVAGPRVSGSMVARLHSNGALDTSFGTGGFVDVSSNYRGFLPRPGGGLLLAAHEYGTSGRPDLPVLLALTADGKPDGTFGRDGQWSNPPHQLNIDALGVTPAGRILLATSSGYYGDAGQVVLALRPDGSIDPGWGDGGRVQGGAARVASTVDLVVAGDGSVLLLDYIGAVHSFWRLTAPGGRDHAFGHDSRARLEARYLGAMAVDEHGRPVAAGGSNGALPLVRTTEGGTPDHEFGRRGRALIPPPRGMALWGAGDVVADGNDGLILAGVAADEDSGAREDFGKSRPFVARVRSWGDFVSLTVRRGAPRRAILGCRSVKPCRGVVEAFVGRRRVSRTRVTVSRRPVAVTLPGIPDGARRIRVRAELVDRSRRFDEAATFTSTLRRGP